MNIVQRFREMMDLVQDESLDCKVREELRQVAHQMVKALERGGGADYEMWTHRAEQCMQTLREQRRHHISPCLRQKRKLVMASTPKGRDDFYDALVLANSRQQPLDASAWSGLMKMKALEEESWDGDGYSVKVINSDAPAAPRVNEHASLSLEDY